MTPRRSGEQEARASGGTPRFPHQLLYRAARLYYLEDATQAEVAEALGTSRPTVSRLLAEARAVGIVRIEVREPRPHDDRVLAERLAEAIGVTRAWVSAGAASGLVGPTLAPAVAEALCAADLRRGDALLVSSGTTVYSVSQQQLPPLPGVALAPTLGGRDEPDEAYQTNEITLRMAVRMQGTPVLLHAPAMPGPALYDLLLQEESIRRVTRLWASAHAALLGIGAPMATRTSLPSMFPRGLDQLQGTVGDICCRPFDRTGEPIPIAGVDHMIAMELHDLRRIPHTIGLAVGAAKVDGILSAARACYINELVTDFPTAQLLLEAVTATRSA
jgi:DNA-binding transcriptional regulator LsrR (DeoR family)